jgi:hypothetical protein
MFDSHPDMAIPQESHFVVNLGSKSRRYAGRAGFKSEAFVQDLCSHWAFQRWGLPEKTVIDSFHAEAPEHLADAMRRVFGLYAEHAGKNRYGDKTPGYVMSMSLLAGLFPESRFIHLIRDGRDVALSYLAAGWGPSTLEGNALFWKRFVSHGRLRGRQLGPSRYVELRYEDLMEEPERNVRALCSFVDLEYDQSMLEYWVRADAVIGNLRDWRAVGHQNLRLPPKQGIRDWRSQLSYRQVAVFEALAGDLLEDLGYERRVPRPSLRARSEARLARSAEQARRAGRAASRASSLLPRPNRAPVK